MKYSIPNFEVSALLFHDKNCRIFQAAVFQIKELTTFFETLSLEVEFYFLNLFVHQTRSLKLVFFNQVKGGPAFCLWVLLSIYITGKCFSFIQLVPIICLQTYLNWTELIWPLFNVLDQINFTRWQIPWKWFVWKMRHIYTILLKSICR